MNTPFADKTTLLTLLSVIPFFTIACASQSPGRLTGNSGGNERVIRIFNQSTGEVWFTYTGPTGKFTSKPLTPGIYLAYSSGASTPIRIQPGKNTTINFAPQPGIKPDFETWSPAKRKFGQTFVANGPFIRRITFWIPSKPIPLQVKLHESNPDGKIIGKFTFDQPKSWVVHLDLQPYQWTTTPGKKYYLSIASTNQQPFKLGTPALGDVYPHGCAWFDDQPQIDVDMGISILQDDDAQITFASVSYHKGYGYQSTGPTSGNCTWAAQTFKAITRNITTAWANAGWPSSEGIKHQFIYSIHEDSPNGPQIGPSRIVTMIKDWGAAALWFPDQIKLTRGKTYALRIARVDQKPFYAYLAPNDYPNGSAHRYKLKTPNMDLTFYLRGQRISTNSCLPTNITKTSLPNKHVRLTWQTALPAYATIHTTLHPTDHPSAHTISVASSNSSTQHTATLPTPPNSRQTIRIATQPIRNGATAFSPTVTLTNYPNPQNTPTSKISQNTPKSHKITLKNSGFEQNLQHWNISTPTGTPPHNTPPTVGRLAPIQKPNGYDILQGKTVLGWEHIAPPQAKHQPTQLKPPVTRAVYQTVNVTRGKKYLLTAYILTDEREGGWNRNDRIRLIADPDNMQNWSTTKGIKEDHVTSWFSTRGTWRPYALAFTASSKQVKIGVQYYQWWLLRQNHLYVDQIRLFELPDNPTAP